MGGYWTRNIDNAPVWSLTEQPTKYGYANNPRWQDPDVTEQHLPCGYWLKNPAASQYGFPKEGGGYVPIKDWGSCSQGVTAIDDVVYFTTSLDPEYPPDVIDFLKFNTTTGEWKNIYTYTLPGSKELTYEPPIASGSYGNYHVYVYFCYDNYTFAEFLQVFVFDQDTLKSNTRITLDTDEYVGGPTYQQKNGMKIAISTTGYMCMAFDAYDITGATQVNLYTLRSTNWGQTWALVTIDTFALATGDYDMAFMGVDSSGDFYCAAIGNWTGNKIKIYKSTDDGATWALISTTVMPANTKWRDFHIFNDNLYLAYDSYGITTMKVYKSIDGGLTFTDYTIINYGIKYYFTPTLTSNGATIYCGIIDWEDGTTALYSSTDGETWIFNGQSSRNDTYDEYGSVYHSLAVTDEVIASTFYYLAFSYYTNLFMGFSYSKDNGQHWITTPAPWHPDVILWSGRVHKITWEAAHNNIIPERPSPIWTMPD